MTAREVIREALTELAEFLDPRQLPNSILLRQISMRQQAVFTAVADVDEEYYGHCAIGTPDANGLVDLVDLTGVGSVPPPAERVTIVRIKDAGTSTYAVGDKIHVVAIDDELATPAPRVYLRDRILQSVGTDLDGVATIEMFYSRRPTAVTTLDDDVEPDEPFAYVLVYDLARFIARRTPGASDGERGAAVDYMTEREGEVMALLEAHVRGYASRRQTRFDR